jgi:hypothetical protein
VSRKPLPSVELEEIDPASKRAAELEEAPRLADVQALDQARQFIDRETAKGVDPRPTQEILAADRPRLMAARKAAQRRRAQHLEEAAREKRERIAAYYAKAAAKAPRLHLVDSEPEPVGPLPALDPAETVTQSASDLRALELECSRLEAEAASAIDVTAYHRLVAEAGPIDPRTSTEIERDCDHVGLW